MKNDDKEIEEHIEFTIQCIYKATQITGENIEARLKSMIELYVKQIVSFIQEK